MVTVGTTSSAMLASVLTASNDSNDDFLHQLRHRLHQIENNVQETLAKIHQRPPFTIGRKKLPEIDENLRKKFLHVLKDVANQNNQPFDEPLFRQHVLNTVDASPSPKVELLRAKVSLPSETTGQALSPVNNTRRSQFAPVLSSTPVHQTSPTMPIPVDLTMATPGVALTADLPAVPPSAIVPQRAATRPPRRPRAESNSRSKKKKEISTVQEENVEEELIIVRSKQRIERKEENVQLVIEEEKTLIADVVKTVQSTPLRGRKKKNLPVEEPIPQLEPPPPPVEPVVELPPKASRAGRNKKKEPTELPKRTSSSRTRKKKDEEDIVVVKEIPAEVPTKRSTRSRKKTEETRPTAEVAEPPIAPASPPKRTTTRSKKRKENEDQVENPVSKRRGAGRRMKSVEKVPEPEPMPTRSSARGKKEIEVVVEKQEEIVLKKKSRSGRGKKSTIDSPRATPEVPTIPISISMDSIVNKPPRPPVARKKKSIAMPSIAQMSPSTPPSTTQRIQSTSPIADPALLPIPVVGRRRQAARRAAAPSSPNDLETLPSTNRNQKRTQSSVAATPKRARRDDLTVAAVLGTPGKKRNKCTCEKRRHRVCDICAVAIDA